MNTRTTLYRMYDREQDLLYAGVTLHVPERLGAHRRAKSWWSEVRAIYLTHFDDREAAEVAERAVIASENPRHNMVLRVDPAPGGLIDRSSGSEPLQRLLAEAGLPPLKDFREMTWEPPSATEVGRTEGLRSRAKPSRAQVGAHGACGTCGSGFRRVLLLVDGHLVWKEHRSADAEVCPAGGQPLCRFGPSGVVLGRGYPPAHLTSCPCGEPVLGK